MLWFFQRKVEPFNSRVNPVCLQVGIPQTHVRHLMWRNHLSGAIWKSWHSWVQLFTLKEGLNQNIYNICKGLKVSIWPWAGFKQTKTSQDLTSNHCTATGNRKNRMQTRAHHPIICLGSKACASGSRRCECKCPCTVAQWFLVWKPLVPPCLPKSIQKQFKFNILNHAQSASSLSKHHRLFCAYRDSMLKKTSNQGLHVVMHTHRRPRRLKR